jgi:ABC-type branched-subunit amino acid transport system permease subunit
MYGNLHSRNFVAIAVVLVLGLVLPIVLPTYFLYIGNVLMMYAILALGLDLLLGWSGQFAFAHIAFFGVGIYGTALLQSRFGIPFVIGLPIAAALAGIIGWLARSRLGRHLCTIRDSEHVAAASGIDVKRTKLIAFTLSAVYAGIAGGAYTLFQSFVNPDLLGVTQLVLVLTMVVVGGPGSIAGVMLGVALIGVLPEVLRAAPRDLLVWQEFFYGLILILAVMFMPRGLWGLVEGRFKSAPAAPARAKRKAALDLGATRQ